MLSHRKFIQFIDRWFSCSNVAIYPPPATHTHILLPLTTLQGGKYFLFHPNTLTHSLPRPLSLSSSDDSTGIFFIFFSNAPVAWKHLRLLQADNLFLMSEWNFSCLCISDNLNQKPPNTRDKPTSTSQQIEIVQPFSSLVKLCLKWLSNILMSDYRSSCHDPALYCVIVLVNGLLFKTTLSKLATYSQGLLQRTEGPSCIG